MRLLTFDAAGTSSAFRFGVGGLQRHSCATPPSRAVIYPRPCCFRAPPSAGRLRREWSPTSTFGAPSSRRSCTHVGKYAGALRFRPLQGYAAAFERRSSRKSYYIAPEDATLVAVEVSGGTLLDLLEYALGVPSYFQTQQLALGFDGGKDRPCRINKLQVGKKLRVRPALL